MLFSNSNLRNLEELNQQMLMEVGLALYKEFKPVFMFLIASLDRTYGIKIHLYII